MFLFVKILKVARVFSRKLVVPRYMSTSVGPLFVNVCEKMLSERATPASRPKAGWHGGGKILANLDIFRHKVMVQT